MQCTDISCATKKAILGALFVDGGLPAAEKFFHGCILDLMQFEIVNNRIVFAHESKRLLQEHLVAYGLSGNSLDKTFQYVTVSKYQGSGTQNFTRAIILLGRRMSIATGRSLVVADQAAAARLLSSLKKNNSTSCLLIRLARNANNQEVLQKAIQSRQQANPDCAQV
eukprot:IDg18889t1